jgi:eukaryotic translation initiation factor 2C
LISIFYEIFYIISFFTAPPPGPSTSGGSVGTAGVAASSVAAPSNMGLVPAQQAHTPPQPAELPSNIFYNSMFC